MVVGLLLLVLVACGPAATSAEAPSPVEKAAAEATAIVLQAEATAIVLRARSTAAALARGEPAAAPTPPAPVPVSAPALPSVSRLTPGATKSPIPVSSTSASPTVGADSTGKDEPRVAVLGASIAADTGLIHVEFVSSPRVARGFYQGNVYVVDEATGAKFNEIPVMPKIGPLIGRPKQDGQAGYVMLVNAGGRLRPGAVVTVVLGSFKQEHVPVR